MAGDSELRRFVDEVVIPAESELDAGGGLELRKLAQDAGLWVRPLPAELRGDGQPLTEYFAMTEDGI